MLTIGSIYGPNGTDIEFYNRLRAKVEDWGLPFILGGDFNTTLCRILGEGNLDREGGGRPPNQLNGNEILKWIDEGDCIEPFRALYPNQKEVSYLPFRGYDREGGGVYNMVKAGLIFF